MDEYIDIVNRKGILTGESCLKSEVHRLGYYHNTAHVWLFTTDGEILLQQRALSKEICPGLWDVSAAGHVDTGETIEDAAIRETFEELNYKLSKTDLIKVGVYLKEQTYPSGIKDNEFHHTYIACLKNSIDELIFDPIEVEAIKLVTIQTFIDLLNLSASNNHFIVSNYNYYINVIDAIKNKL